MIRSLIIDDDPFIQELLRDKLSLYVPEVSILATADSGMEGLAKIRAFQPDLIFLDVEMADMTGFEMLAQLTDISFQIIFITSYSHYAIKAIRFNALDYLVKPIDLGELKKAIQRYKQRRTAKQPLRNLDNALHNFRTTNVAEHKLVLQTQEGELHLVLKDIIRIEGERNYSYIYLAKRKRKLVAKTLLDLEDLLQDKGFFRCHKSFIVNAAHIQSAPTRMSLLLSDETSVPIARRKKDAFTKWWADSQHGLG